MRWSVLIGLMVSSLCLAAPSKSQRLGSSHEDDDVPLIAAPGPGEADAALLKALLWALEPGPTEIRVIAIEDLGLLADARALNPLAELLMDPNPAVQNAALRAIAAMRYPRAEEILSNVARHPTLPERLKLSAVEWVLYQNTDTAIAFLKHVARSTGFNPTLQNAAKRALVDVPPTRLEASR